LLAENSLLFQRLAIGPCRAVHLDADPEPSATNFAQVTATQGVQAIEKVSAQFRGALDHLLLDENAQRGTGHGAAQRIAAKGAAVVAGLVNAQNLLGGQHGGDGIEAAGQRLADNEHVGVNSLAHVGKELAGAAEAGLDFVGHEEHPVAAANVRGFAQIAGGRENNASLALDGLDQEGTGVGGDGVSEGARIAIGDDLEAGGKGTKAAAILLVSGETDDSDGAAVKIVGTDNNLGQAVGYALHGVAPLARGLDRGLHRFRA